MVNCAVDPAALAAKVRGVEAFAVKQGGVDVAPWVETAHCRAVWTAAGFPVGTWVYCSGPPNDDVATAAQNGPWPFVVYDVEAEYKSDEGGHYEWAAMLVKAHRLRLGSTPAAVTSYGGYKSSIAWPAFVAAGWPVVAQCYDTFTPADAPSYLAVYPIGAIRVMTRALADLAPRWCYRPESDD